MNKLNRDGLMPRPIRKWACHKLECFADYLDSYTRSRPNIQRCYLELYASCGRCICTGTDCCIEDASLRALKKNLARYIFVVSTRQDAESLERLTKARSANNIDIITGNCNNVKIIRQFLDLIPRSASSLAFLDPPGYRMLRWNTIKHLAAHGADWKGNKMELLIAFPLEMALVRNLTRPECQASISRLYGDQRWVDIRKHWLEGKIRPDDVRQQLVKLFKDGLKDLGYRYVDSYRPAAFSKSPFYHLIWASDKDSGAIILKDAWGQPRYLPCELLYNQGAPHE
ncbi:three-Cys-motif partner protein TcmP [Chloroflexota bacterium]